MKLEDQLTSRELSERLKKLGVKQESEFYWSDYPVWRIHHQTYRDGTRNMEDICRKVCSAFTVAELGEKLHSSYTTIKTARNKWLAFSTGNIHGNVDFKNTLSDTKANARAKMLIHLIEKGIVKL